MDRDKVQALTRENNNYDAEMLLSEFSRNEIIWWKKNEKWIRDPKVDFYLETDASKAGWGANLNGKTTGGRWSETESVLHINVLEIMAIKFALQSLCQNMENTILYIFVSDQITVKQFHILIIKVDQYYHYLKRQRVYGFDVTLKISLFLLFILQGKIMLLQIICQDLLVIQQNGN